MNSHRDLQVWRKAMTVVVQCYQISNTFPKSEMYGLTSQLRRSAVSVPANIAEGHARRRTKEYLHHLDIAYGSLAETETHIELAALLGYVAETESNSVLARMAEVGRMLNGLMRSLDSKVDIIYSNRTDTRPNPES